MVALGSGGIQGDPDGTVHHICTDKNSVSEAEGGPWTPLLTARGDPGSWLFMEGKPASVEEPLVGMRIDKSRAGDAKIFRPWGWTVVLVVSEDIKDALERTGATGMKFTEV